MSHSYSNQSRTTANKKSHLLLSSSLLERNAEQAADEIRATLGLWTSPQLLGTTLETTTTTTNNNNNNNNNNTTPTTNRNSRKKSERYHNEDELEDDYYDVAENNYIDDDEEDDDDEIFMDAATLVTVPALENTTGTSTSSRTITTTTNTTTTAIPTTTSTSKRTKITHRSSTPVMSNNSKIRGDGGDGMHSSSRNSSSSTYHHGNENAIMREEMTDVEVPYNVQSPWVQKANTTTAGTRGSRSRHSSNHRTTTPIDDSTGTGDANTTTTTTRTTIHPSMTPTMTTTTRNNMVHPHHFGESYQPYYSATERLWRFYNHPLLIGRRTPTHPDPVFVSNTIPDINNNSDNNNDNDNRMVMWMDTTAMRTTTTTTTTTTNTIVPTGPTSTPLEELKMELEYLRTLHQFGWSQSAGGTHPFKIRGSSRSSHTHPYPPTTTTTEGNFWLLLYHLRQLGLATLLWDNDTASLQQHDRSIQSHIQSISIQTNRTPAAILRSFYHTTTTTPPVSTTHDTSTSTTATTTNTNTNTTTTFVSPLPIQRRKLLLEWLHQCFQQQLPSDILSRSCRTTKIVGPPELLQKNTHLYECGLYRTDQDEELLLSCLSLLLAGRFYPDALALVRNHHVPWRAALWSGGRPHGYTTVSSSSSSSSSHLVSVGNPGRALWRRSMWHHSEALAAARGNHATNQRDVEVAIAALLSSNLKLALDCTPLRSWEGGLYCILRCMMDRMEDDLLHRHNNFRRSVRNGASYGPLYPGTEYETSEREHLQETYDLATMDEGEAIRILEATPFPEMRGDDMFHQATVSFIVGKSAIVSFLQTSVENVTTLTSEELRFVTHVAFYLDALSYSATTPVAIPNVKQWKNDLVMHYLSFLASQDDLWYMIVLYASFLPVHTILDHLPKLLEKMESMEQRKVIVQQMREFLPQKNLDLEVLRRVVDFVISEPEDSDDQNKVDNEQRRTLIEPSALDIRKMESVLWLTIQIDHAGEALVAANRLLRKFFLAGHKKISSAILFADEVLNDFLTSFVYAHASMEDMDQNDYSARLEHQAYLLFLEATKAVQNWKDVVRQTHPTLWENSADDEVIDKNGLNVTELAIAMNAERRKVIDNKRTTTRHIVTATEQACHYLRQILEHTGGWLLTEDEVVPPTDDVNGLLRRKELDQLRSDLLPHVVFMYHDVCVGTALWMSKSLDDTAEALQIPAKEAVREIDETWTDQIATSPVAPRYWTTRALELAEMTMNERYNVKSAFRIAEYKALLSLLAETTAIDCMYRYAE